LFLKEEVRRRKERANQLKIKGKRSNTSNDIKTQSHARN